MSAAEFNLLGPLEIRADGREVPIAGFTRRAVLGFLLLNTNRVVSIGELTSALWTSEHPPTARGIVLNVVSALRKVLHTGPAELLTQKPGYVLRLDPGLVDLYRFRTLAASLRSDPADIAANLRSALGLWRGPALADLVADGVAWPALAEIENSRSVVLEDCLDAELACGRHREVLPELETLVREQPLRERLRGQLMLALYRSGRQADALAAYRAAREHFIDELGIEPGLELRELERAILAHDPALRPPRMSEPLLTVERKRVSVLAVRLTVSSDEALDAALDRVRKDVARFGGVVTSVLGSTVCAAFGVPRSREDDARRAVAAAEAVVRPHQHRGCSPTAKLVDTARAAVVTGPALVGSGNRELTGRLLDEALRLVASAPDGGVELCDVTRAACATDDLPLAPFVGRTAELGRLRDGRGPRLVTVIGTPGVGKSRLIREFSREARCLIGRTPTFGRDAPFQPLADIVRAHAGVLDSDSPEVAAEKLRTVTDDPWLYNHLSALLGLGQAGPNVLAAFRRFAEQVAPAAVIIEDVHWADDALLDFVRSLAESVPVIATARPELLDRRPGWDAITLAPLGPGESESLLRSLLERHGVTVPSLGPLLDLTAGNPLFTVEYVRMLRDGSPASTTSPDTVQTVIAARLDTLPPVEKAVLRDASVVGGVVWTGAVAAISERPVSEVAHALEALRRKEFLRRSESSTVAGETEYAFTHVLVRDVAYGQIPLGQKQMMHYHAAVWVRALPVEHVELLGHHFREAVLIAEATGNQCEILGANARAALMEAGHRATSLAARETAVRCYRFALEVCPEDHEDRPNLLLRLGTALVWEGSGEDVLTEAAEALVVAGDVAGAAEAELALWRLSRGRHDEPAARGHLDRVLALVTEAPPSDRLTGVQSDLTKTLALLGRCEEVFAVAAAVERTGTPAQRAQAVEARGMARVKLGDAGGLADIESAIAAMRRNGMCPALALYNFGTALGLAGDLGRRHTVRLEARSTAERFGDSYTLGWLDRTAYIDHYWSGDLVAAEAAVDAVIAAEPSISNHLAMRARIRLFQDDLAGAHDDAVNAFSLGVAMLNADAMQDLVAVRARLALAYGDIDLARSLAHRLLGMLDGRCVRAVVGADLPIVLAATGYGVDALDRVAPSRWLDAARAYLRGDRAGAAKIYTEIGSRPDAMSVQLSDAPTVPPCPPPSPATTRRAPG
ncbi:hypothetical protein Lesp02_08330 [Lentzea sp. NBRC 105346]|uniref:BTAD domain-containing putative transcriptional regulator n=1 Tax=Lentzea sp. NBRC 105346 TaxID=3032205 RepID=UPI0024A0E156|nr:BTAD domain-containing putative transcriptional regulator [Lentzea sp. NBRC 105346]GLZ28643.1 hypothetical protein Lesp02_08330 [Lentzea sp. NBRC 105346]